MKKIIFLFLILFISILTVKADSTFYLGDKVPDMYIESINGSDMHNGAPFLIRRMDGSLVYCINPFKMINTTEYYKEHLYNDPIFNLTDEQLNKLNIISYFGYGYNGHTDIKWYGITQFMLWKSLGFTDVYFTDVYYGNKVEKYQNEVSELENLINDYYKLPSFYNNYYEYDPNNTYELIDTNNVLSNYIIEESNVGANINDNKLVINTMNSGNYEIKFIRKSPIKRDYALYNLDGYQSLIFPGKINDISFSISIRVNSGSITVNKYDSKDKNALSDGIFGIYKDNNLISELVINEGSTYIENLSFGNYTLKELVAPKGYNKDNNIYNVTISKDNKDIIINSYSKVIEGNLIINKYYASENDYKLDNSSVFEVYNDDKLIKTLSGEINEKLEYGTYLVKHISGKKYYDLADDFYVSILEEKDYVYDLYTDKTDEIKAYEDLLNKREESLNKKEEVLTEILNKIENEKNSLTNLKTEISEKEKELDLEKEELKLKEEELSKLENKLLEEKGELSDLKNQIIKEQEQLDIKKEELVNAKEDIELKEQVLINLEKELEKEKELLEKLKEDLTSDSILINKKEEELIQKENMLDKLKQELDLLSKKIDEKEKKINELENTINDKEIILNKREKELNKLNNQLNEKQNYINNKEIELNKKEELIKLENKREEDVLIVEVPNTSKRSYKKIISVILMFIGSILIIYSKKKVTSC